MAEPSTKRRREPYSRLICLGCRQRRIRCTLPDTSITPSSEPQPPDKACQRCAQNGLDCIVDYTTLGRPAQKRNRPEQEASQQRNHASGAGPDAAFEDDVSHDVGDFLLSNPDGIDSEGSHPALPPTRTEMIEACFSPFHLLPALLARDREFAVSIGSQPLVRQSVMELIDDETTELLDRHLVWHRLYFPDIPALDSLRKDISTMERGHAERPSCMFLLTLLYDLALDVPAVELAACRSFQPAVRALLFHAGQQVLFSLVRTNWTVLSLVLVAQYRPLAFTSSQPAAAPALKAVPYALLAKQICTELGYDTAGARLIEALNGFDTDVERLSKLIQQCLYWIQLGIAHEMILNASVENVFKFRPADAATAECAEALGTASLLGRIPAELLLPCLSTCGLFQMLVALTEMSMHWKDLKQLEKNMTAHKAYVEQEKEALETALEAQKCSIEHSTAVLHLAAMDMQIFHNSVKGCALFFCVMCGAYAPLSQVNVQPDQAMEISNNIIQQLIAHQEDNPERPSHRKFLEDFGRTRINELELDLANFVTACDTLVLNGVPFVGPLRQSVTNVLFTSKDIVEQQAARLKGWGGLDDRIDIQMILFQEVARRLEAMSASAGTPEALSKGCILTATAKLIRSLHRVLTGFKRTAMMIQRKSVSGSSRQTATPGTGTTSTGTESAPDADPLTQIPSWDSHLCSDDIFGNWENWPQFDPADFSDLFEGVFDWEERQGYDL